MRRILCIFVQLIREPIAVRLIDKAIVLGIPQYVVTFSCGSGSNAIVAGVKRLLGSLTRHCIERSPLAYVELAVAREQTLEFVVRIDVAHCEHTACHKR